VAPQPVGFFVPDFAPGRPSAGCEAVGVAGELVAAGDRAEPPEGAVTLQVGVVVLGTAMPHTGSVAMVASSRKAPSSSHSTRSAISSRRLSWLTITTARRSSVASWRSSRATWRPMALSRLAVGSSARINRGSLASARTIATRCFSPPDSCSGRKPSR
jgi:hypothetical protein